MAVIDENYYDSVGEENPENWDRPLFIAGKALQSRELNELVSLQEFYSDKLGRSVHTREGIIIDGVIPKPDPDAGVIRIEDGKIFLAGKVRDIPGVGEGTSGDQIDPLVISADGEEVVGLNVEFEIIKASDDESLLDPSGYSNKGLDGAYRQRLKTSWVVYTPDEIQSLTSFIEIFRLKDGVVINLPVSTVANIDEILEQRTYEESGHYKVNGFQSSFTKIEDPEKYKENPDPDTRLLLSIGSGVAYAGGRRMDYKGGHLFWEKAREEAEIFEIMTPAMKTESVGMSEMAVSPYQKPIASINSISGYVRTPFMKVTHTPGSNKDNLVSSDSVMVSDMSNGATNSAVTGGYFSGVLPGSIRLYTTYLGKSWNAPTISTSPYVLGVDYTVSGSEVTWLKPVINSLTGEVDVPDSYYATWEYSTNNGHDEVKFKEGKRIKATGTITIEGYWLLDYHYFNGSTPFPDGGSKTQGFYIHQVPDNTNLSTTGITIGFPESKNGVSDIISVESIHVTDKNDPNVNPESWWWPGEYKVLSHRDEFGIKDLRITQNNLSCGARVIIYGTTSKPRPSVTTKLTVNYTYWKTLEDGDYFTRYSYFKEDGETLADIEDIQKPEDISAFNTIKDLSNYIDFRKNQYYWGLDETYNTNYHDSQAGVGTVTTGVVGIRPPVANLPLSVNYNIYLPRMDLVTINKTAKYVSDSIIIHKGKSSVKPSYPPVASAEELTILKISSEGNSDHPIIISASTNRFTMEDIGFLKSRIERLESQLVEEALQREADVSLALKSQTSVTSLLKKGVFTDPLLDFSRIDSDYNLVTSGDPPVGGSIKYNVAMDFLEGSIRFPFNIKLPVDPYLENKIDTEESTNIYLGDKSILINYTEKLEMQQPLTTTYYDVNQFGSFSSDAHIELDPAVEWWVDTGNSTVVTPIDKKAVVNYYNDQIIDSSLWIDNKATSVSLDNIYEWWTLYHFGLPASLIGSPIQYIPGAYSTLNHDGTVVSSPSGNASRPVAFSKDSVGFVAQALRLTSSPSVARVGNDFLVSQDIRLARKGGREVTITGCLFPPLKTIVGYLDGKEINLTPVGSVSVGTATSNGTTTIKSDSNGEFVAKLTIPVNTTNHIASTGISTIECVHEAETVFDTRVSASATYLSSPHVYNADSGMQSINPVSFNDSVSHTPLAQTFIPQRDIFVSSIDLFFTSKGSGGVLLEIRTMNNNTPSGRVLASSYVPYANINIGATTKTNFKFTDPPFVAAGIEYAFVLKTRGTGFRVGVAKTGGTDASLGTSFVSAQYGVGTMYKANSTSAWASILDYDMKFTLYRAKFDLSETSVLDFGYIPVGDAVGLLVSADSLSPSNTDIRWEFRVDSGGSFENSGWITIPPFTNTLMSTYFTSIQLKATLSSTSDNVSPNITKEGLGLLAWMWNPSQYTDGGNTTYYADYISDNNSLYGENYDSVVVTTDEYTPSLSEGVETTKVSVLVSTDTGMTWNDLAEDDTQNTALTTTEDKVAISNGIYQVTRDATGSWKKTYSSDSGTISEVTTATDNTNFRLRIRLTSTDKSVSPAVAKIRAIVHDS
jgi:hypothetical protein